MKNCLLLLTLLAAGSMTPVFGEALTPDEALQRALGSGPARIAPHSLSAYTLAYTEEMPSVVSPAFYVFNRSDNGGFIVASADDSAPGLLGVVNGGEFDEARLPANFKWWLDQYAAQIEWASETATANPVNSIQAGSLGKVAPKEYGNVPMLLTTTWNQDAPYNQMCPEYHGQKSVTGCVATAMAQVIRYHRWPESTGHGSNSYISNGQQLSYDFETATFDWENMLDSYLTDSATDEQREAVANLMYACGVSVNMSYTSEMSSAFTEAIAYALVENFGYDEAASFVSRDTYTQEQWNDLVYNEVASGRPVLYAGNDGQVGHQFVCDGYTDGLFHINWGWGGYCDGDFLLSALNPSGSGIGGGSGAYNFGQSIIAGVGRPGTVDNFTPVSPLIASVGFTLGDYEDSEDYYNVSFNFLNGGLFNHSRYDLPGVLGVCVKNSDGSQADYIEAGAITFPGMNVKNGNLSGIGSYGVAIPKVTVPGTYHITPAFKAEEGEWQECGILNTASQYVEMTVAEDGTTAFADGKPLVMPTLEVTGFYNEQGYFVSGELTVLFMDCKNGDVAFNGILSLNAKMSGSDEEILIDFIQLSVIPNIEGTLSFTYQFNLPAGMYEFYFKDSFGNMVSPNFSIEVKEIVLATSLSLDPTNVVAVEGDEFDIVATIEPENVTDSTLFWSSSDEEVAVVDQNGHVKVNKEGHATIFAETVDGSDIVATCGVSSISAIEFVQTSDLRWDIVTPTGVVVRKSVAKNQISGLYPGLYILRNGSRAVKVVVE